MYSSEKPCTNEKLVYASEVSGKKVIHVCLTEDRIYRVEDISRSVREASNLPVEDVENLIDKLLKFFNDLRKYVMVSVEAIHGSKIPLDFPLPRARGNALNPGEIVGSFELNEQPVFILHVEPKITWDAYTRMINDTRTTLDTIVSETGVIEPFIGNFYYPFLSSRISYSIILSRLTEHILRSMSPRKITEIFKVSETEVGKPVVSWSLRYAQQGIPLAVYERRVADFNLHPFMLLAKFHYMIAMDIINMVERLRNQIRYTPVLHLVLRDLERIRDIHLLYLATHPLSDAFYVLQQRNISDHELLAETRRASRTNPSLNILADLYEMYISSTRLIQLSVEKGYIVPVISSKIYELWVLTRIIEYMRKRKIFSKFLIREHTSLYAEFDLDKVKIQYNKPLRGIFVGKLTDSHLRPDYIFSQNNRATMVYDAKYKEKLSVNDVTRLLAYIVEFAEPVELANLGQTGTKMLIGGFYKLKAGGIEHTAYSVVKNEGLPCKIVVYTVPVDPRMADTEVDRNIEASFKPMLLQ